MIDYFIFFQVFGDLYWKKQKFFYFLTQFEIINHCVWFISDLEVKPVGILEVKLVQGKELTNKDIIGKSDPFATLFIRPLRDRTKTSKTIVRKLTLTLCKVCLSYCISNNS